MALVQERVPQQQETLVFPSPEQAGEFRDRVHEKLQQPRPATYGQKDVIREEVTAEFEKQGEAVGQKIPYPWEHTQQEHEEAQKLVNIAFERDLAAAIKTARSSRHYPRNLDLFHDVLTNEMYDALQEHHVNTVSVGLWALGAAGAGFGIVLVVLVLLAL